MADGEVRPEDRVAREVEEAITRFCERMDRSVDRGEITEDQVSSALTGYPDFADSWDEWLEEGRG